MFEPGDPEPEPFDWGPRKWATEEAYDEDLAKFLGDLACGSDVPEAQTRGLARRALDLRTSGRVRPPLAQALAARLIGPDCPPAKGLPDDMRRQLEELAAEARRRPPRHRRLPARSRRVRLCDLDRLARGWSSRRTILAKRSRSSGPKSPRSCRPCGYSSGGMPDRGQLDSSSGNMVLSIGIGGNGEAGSVLVVAVARLPIRVLKRWRRNQTNPRDQPISVG